MILTAFHSFPASKANGINNLLNPFPEQFLKEKQKCNTDNLFTVNGKQYGFHSTIEKYTDKLGNLEVGKSYASGFMNLGNLIRLILPFASSVNIYFFSLSIS